MDAQEDAYFMEVAQSFADENTQQRESKKPGIGSSQTVGQENKNLKRALKDRFEYLYEWNL